MDLVTATVAELADVAMDSFRLGLLQSATGTRRLTPRELAAVVGVVGERYHATRFHAVYKAGYDLGVQNAMELKRREQNAANRA